MRASLSRQRGEGMRVKGGWSEHFSKDEGTTTFPPLTPALSPLRGEGDAFNSRRSSNPRRRDLTRRLYGRRQKGSNAAHGLTFTKADRRAPSPLNGERAGVRGEAVPTRLRPGSITTSR